MKKKIWIWNHYATNMFFDKAGRHYWFSKNLLKEGYEPVIFCASTNHFSDNHIDTKGKRYLLDYSNDIPFVFVKTLNYKRNGIKRVYNMISFYAGLLKAATEHAKTKGKPDIILASSVHPLTLVAGIKIAKKLGIPCICEVRDLWPESIITFGMLRRNNIIAKLLYRCEKWIYEKADKVIFTMEGGKKYIKDQGWDKENGGPIELSKVHYINNGIDIVQYDKNRKTYIFEDDDLDNPYTFKVVYIGSIRKANNLNLIVEAAKYIKGNNKDKVRFLIFGTGDEKENLEKKCHDEKISNVIFKGKVDKAFIPNILSKANVNVLNYSYYEIWKYGGSQNKSFEYLASGKPILSTITMGYDIIEKYKAGISLKRQDPETIGKSIISIVEMEHNDYLTMSTNSRTAAFEYDFKILTKKLIGIIENI